MVTNDDTNLFHKSLEKLLMMFNDKLYDNILRSMAPSGHKNSNKSKSFF